jgi:dTDP-4-amino-4,6-dideoxygalactose transaminase
MKLKIDWPARGHTFSEDEINTVASIMRLEGTALTQGSHVEKFEEGFRSYIQSHSAHATMSCAHALDIAAMLSEIRPNDEVIIPSHTYCATAISFARYGAKLIWADIDKETFSVSLENIKKLVTSKTKVIVVVHIYGLVNPDIKKIAKYAKESNILLVEDCAQSLGAKFEGQHCGTFGDIGCYSFHAQKNITTLGEGGMITVKSKNQSLKVPSIRLNGHVQYPNKNYYWLPAMTNVDEILQDYWPFKSTMTEVQAAVGLLTLGRLDQMTEMRRARGMAFRSEMKEFKELQFQKIPSTESHSHHLLPARYISQTSNRNDLISILYDTYGIKAIVQYHPLHRYDLFKKKGFSATSIPETDMFFDNMISFPFSLTISDDDFKYLIDSVKSAIQSLRQKK